MNELFVGPPWMEGGGGGMRHKFQPRFEPPGEFFRGPPGGGPGGPMGPPGMYDDSPHPRHRRYDDRRRHNRPDYDGEKERDRERERPERSSRWSSGSPRQEDSTNVAVSVGDDGGGSAEDAKPQESIVEEVATEDKGGNTTPLHDEPQEPQQNEAPPPEEIAAPPETAETSEPVDSEQ